MTVSANLQQIPFLDLSLQHEKIRGALLDDLSRLVESSAFVNGPDNAAFEESFARYCGTSDCVGVASGLDAIRLALAALDLEPGAQVVVPALTFVATWEAVSQTGAVPVPVDINEADYCLDLDRTEAAIDARIGAIVPVHLYGQMADMCALLTLCERHRLPIVEDAAQAHGATRAGLRAGAAGAAGAFSFYPGKNLGALGDAGAIVTNDAETSRRARALREHGQVRKYHHDEIGWTARLDTVQAAFLQRKLPLLDGWNDERRRIAATYLEALRDTGDLSLPPVPEDSQPVWHLFVVRTSDPDGLAAHLRSAGIVTGRHYPEPPHLSRAYASLGYKKGSFPVAEAIARECLSLPIFPGMSESQVERVVDAVTSWFNGG